MKLTVIKPQLKSPPLAGLLQELQLEPNFWLKAAITQAPPYNRRSNKPSTSQSVEPASDSPKKPHFLVFVFKITQGP